MGIVEEFIARYRREYDFYDQAARLVAQTLDADLQNAGVRSLVTSRAKAVTRLEVKIRQREEKKPYATVDAIYEDIADLAGVRVALYFPGEQPQVDSLVRDLFELKQPKKVFPEEEEQEAAKDSKSEKPAEPKYIRRFSGYRATHYRVQLPKKVLNESQSRYADARVEIQVASILMHAWAEVEHDLVYKPSKGSLSEDEYAILDQLNGLVIAGEIALERLQRAGEARIEAEGREFSSHYDLATYLLKATASIGKDQHYENVLGRVDILFALIRGQKFATPKLLEPYLEALHSDFERRPVAEQIVDQLIAGEPELYELHNRIRRDGHAGSAVSKSDDDESHVVTKPGTESAILAFIFRWMDFERKIRTESQTRGPSVSRNIFPTDRVLRDLDLFDSKLLAEIERIRRMRNSLVHGLEVPNLDDLRKADARLQVIMAKLPSSKA